MSCSTGNDGRVLSGSICSILSFAHTSQDSAAFTASASARPRSTLIFSSTREQNPRSRSTLSSVNNCSFKISPRWCSTQATRASAIAASHSRRRTSACLSASRRRRSSTMARASISAHTSGSFLSRSPRLRSAPHQDLLPDLRPLVHVGVHPSPVLLVRSGSKPVSGVEQTQGWSGAAVFDQRGLLVRCCRFRSAFTVSHLAASDGLSRNRRRAAVTDCPSRRAVENCAWSHR